MTNQGRERAPKPVLEAVSAETESKFTRALGSTDYHTREAGLAALQTWLARKSDIEELDLLKLWKGIFYCFWHSDKAAVQTALAERLSEIMTQLPEQVGWLYYATFVRTMRREWAGIDRLRLDKFMMLMRKIFAATLHQLQAHTWQQRRVQRLADCWLHEILVPEDTLVAAGVAYHLTDLLLPELARCLQDSGGGGVRPSDTTLRALLEPFCTALAATTNPALVYRLRQGVFDPLVEEVRQAGEVQALQDLDAAFLATHLFDLGARPETRARNREALYAISSALEKAAAKRHRTEWQGEGWQPPKPAQQRKERQQQEQLELEAPSQAQAQQKTPGSGSKSSGKRRRQSGGGEETAAPVAVAPLQMLQQPAAVPASQAEAEPASAGPSSSQKKKQNRSRLAPAEAAQLQAAARQQQIGAAAAQDGEQQQQQRGRLQSQDIPTREQELLAAAVAAVTGGGGEGEGKGTPGCSSSKKKNVRFSLRKNLVNVIGQPPKPADIRTPPTAKPKGPALKRLSAFGGPASAPEHLLTRAGKDRLTQCQSFMNGYASIQPTATPARPVSASKAAAGSGGKKRRAALSTPGSFSRPRATDFF